MKEWFDFQETRIAPFFLAFSVECTSLTRSQEGFTASSIIGGTLPDQGSGIPPAGEASQRDSTAAHCRVFGVLFVIGCTDNT